MAVTAIVLGAGRGVRLGGPKALLLVDGRPLLDLHVARAREAGAREVVAVVRPELVTHARALLIDRAVVAASEAPDPFGSLRVGLAAAGCVPRAIVVVTPVDAVPAIASTWRALVEAVAGGASAAVPTYLGRGGHPVALARATLDVHGVANLRELLKRVGAARVAVDDARVITDLDTADDVLRATGAAPSFARA